MFTTTFIGHNDCYGVTKENIKKVISNLINEGSTVFLNGGQGGFDRLCGQCVYEMKKEYKNIKNYLVIPYLNFNVYNENFFDEIIYPEGFEKYYFKSAIIKKNDYLVKNSDYAVCYVCHTFGGAYSTYKKALENNLKIINLGTLQ